MVSTDHRNNSLVGEVFTPPFSLLGLGVVMLRRKNINNFLI